MKKYLFFGDSFTYGQDAEDDKSTWPYHYLTMIEKQDTNYAIKAKPGQSNSGIFLDILESYQKKEIDRDSIVFVGLTNIYRDCTTVATHGFHKFLGNQYHSVNAHTESKDKVLNTYRDSFILEKDWILYTKALQYIFAIENLLNKVGCKFYLIDIILSYDRFRDALDIDWNLCKNFITSPYDNKWNTGPPLSIYHYMLEELNIPLSPSKHFYSEGYYAMAKVVKDQIDKYEKNINRI